MPLPLITPLLLVIVVFIGVEYGGALPLFMSCCMLKLRLFEKENMRPVGDIGDVGRDSGAKRFPNAMISLLFTILGSDMGGVIVGGDVNMLCDFFFFFER